MIGFQFRGLSISSLPSMPVNLTGAEAHWLGKTRDTETQFVVDSSLPDLSPATIVDVVSESLSEMDDSSRCRFSESPLAVDAVLAHDDDNEPSAEPSRLSESPLQIPDLSFVRFPTATLTRKRQSTSCEPMRSKLCSLTLTEVVDFCYLYEYL